MCLGVPQQNDTFGEMPMEERGSLLKQRASQGAPSEVGETVPLWLSVVFSVLEACCTWQRGREKEKAVKSRFGVHLEGQPKHLQQGVLPLSCTQKGIIYDSFSIILIYAALCIFSSCFKIFVKIVVILLCMLCIEAIEVMKNIFGKKRSWAQ